MRWYVLKSKPRAERQVESYLAAHHVDVYCPLLRRRGRLAPRTQPFEVLFPGYLFCRVGDNPEHWKLARWSPGTASILGDGDQPVPVPDAVIEAIRARVAVENQLGPAVRFQQGDRAVGPLARPRRLPQQPDARRAGRAAAAQAAVENGLASPSLYHFVRIACSPRWPHHAAQTLSNRDVQRGLRPFGRPRSSSSGDTPPPVFGRNRPRGRPRLAPGGLPERAAPPWDSPAPGQPTPPAVSFTGGVLRGDRQLFLTLTAAPRQPSTTPVRHLSAAQSCGASLTAAATRASRCPRSPAAQ
ncbi:MAG: transcription termination/antitermination NusG family protein [Chloroflexi bacterium]|nr:transcription termination/antitermination NusG family protein [Chloroflexota bacterium]